MVKPIILLSSNENAQEDNFYLRKGYVDSVHKAGGIALILPPVYNDLLIEKYVEICQGIILTGGGDIDPFLFGEQPTVGLGDINPLRDYVEIKIASLAIKRKIPILGICRGCQILNVAAGGTVIQDINSNICHEQKAPRSHPFHDIFIDNNSQFARIVNSANIRVNSFHHQAVGVIGEGFSVSARSRDDIIEAIEKREHPFCLGVQWHPECLNDKNSENLFHALLKQAASFKNSK